MLFFLDIMIANDSNVWISNNTSYDPAQYFSVLWMDKKFPLVGVGHPDRFSVPSLCYTNKVSHSWLVMCLVPPLIYIRSPRYP